MGPSPVVHRIVVPRDDQADERAIRGDIQPLENLPGQDRAPPAVRGIGKDIHPPDIVQERRGLDYEDVSSLDPADSFGKLHRIEGVPHTVGGLVADDAADLLGKPVEDRFVRTGHDGAPDLLIDYIDVVLASRLCREEGLVDPPQKVNREVGPLEGRHARPKSSRRCWAFLPRQS